jgi:hypothetical protein
MTLTDSQTIDLTTIPKLSLKRTSINGLYEPLPGNVALDSRWHEPSATTRSSVTACTMGSTSACCC